MLGSTRHALQNESISLIGPLWKKLNLKSQTAQIKNESDNKLPPPTALTTARDTHIEAILDIRGAWLCGWLCGWLGG